jgi:hypothetical protein
MREDTPLAADDPQPAPPDARILTYAAALLQEPSLDRVIVRLNQALSLAILAVVAFVIGIARFTLSEILLADIAFIILSAGAVVLSYMSLLTRGTARTTLNLLFLICAAVALIDTVRLAFDFPGIAAVDMPTLPLTACLASIALSSNLCAAFKQVVSYGAADVLHATTLALSPFAIACQLIQWTGIWRVWPWGYDVRPLLDIGATLPIALLIPILVLWLLLLRRMINATDAR